MKRGWEVFTFAGCDQDRVSRPSAAPHLWQVSPHLYKVRGHEYWVNFHMLVSDDGHALLSDCGLFDRTHLDRVLDAARERLGIKGIDAILVTHMHGDHFLDAEHVRLTRGCEIWTHERVVDLLERPLDYDYDAMIPSYRERPTGDIQRVKVDRILADGEVVHWRGHTLACDWMPGQTEFACCVHGEIDGRRVAFTGDNIFGWPADPAQHGHEAARRGAPGHTPRHRARSDSRRPFLGDRASRAVDRTLHGRQRRAPGSAGRFDDREGLSHLV